MDLQLKNYLMEEFEPMTFEQTFKYINSLDRDILNLYATKLAVKEQRLTNKTPMQQVGETEEKKKELEKKILPKG